MKFTRENCLGDDYGKAFAMALLEKSGLEIEEEQRFIGFYTKTEKVKFYHNQAFKAITWKLKCFEIKFQTLFDLFSDPLSPTQEECTMFSL